MAQFDKGQTFREELRVVDATGVVDQPLATIASGGATLTINPNSSPAATSIGGVVAFTGGYKAPVEVTTAATDTLLANDSGKVLICAKTSATATFTLPSAATAGLIFTFVTTSAASEVLLTPITGQTIQTKATVDQGASVAPAAGTGIKNTAATNVVGDFITIVSDGVTGWVTIAQSGIWASQ